jgi:iron-sulfur cluster assembly protein
MSNPQSDAAHRASLIEVTPEALEELRRLQTEAAEEVEGIRLGVKGGGCSGFSYLLEFSRQRENDRILDIEGVRFLMDPKSAIYLKGIVLDYKKGLKGRGFVFQNPNASSTCGCGESFSV